MRNIQNSVQQILSDKKRNSQFVAFFIALSMLITFVMPYLTIMSSIADYNDAVELGTTSYIDEETGEEKDYFKVDATINNETIYSSSGQAVNTNFKVDGDSASIYFGMEFGINGIDKNYFPSAGPHMVIKTAGLFGSEADFRLVGGQQGDYTDNDYYVNTGKPTGTYQIDDNGNVWITLEDEYIQHLIDTGHAKGIFTLEGTIGRSKEGNGNQKVTIAGQEIEVKFSDRYPKVDKTGTINETDGTITWTITIENSHELNLGGYKIKDIMLSKADGNITQVPSDFCNENNGVYEIKEGINAPELKLQYKTKIDYTDLQKGNITNKAELGKDDFEPNKPSYSSKETTVTFWKQLGVNKVGNPNYETKEVDWTITITNAHGVSLDGYILEDTYAKKDENGNYVNQPFDLTNAKVSPSGSSIVLEDGKYKLNTAASSVTITYSTAGDDVNGLTAKNNVKVKYPDDEPTGKEDEREVRYKKESEFYTVSKNGYYDQNNGLITWTITLKGENGRNLKGYEVTDNNFPASIEDFAFIKGSKNDVSLNGHKLKVNSEEATEVIFSYTTKAKDGGIDLTKTEEQTVVNEIEDNKENPKEKAEVKVTPRNSLNKNIVARKDKDGNNIYSNTHSVKTKNEIIDTLSWKVELTRDAGFKGYTYTDTIKALDGATHTLDMDSLVVKYNGTALNSQYYTVSSTSTGFEVKFSDNINEDYRNLTIEYETTATVPKDAAYGSYSFTNEGTGTGGVGSGEIGYGITKSDPNEIRRHDVNVNKKWDGNTAPATSVTVKLMYKTNENSTWKEVRESGGKYLFDGEEGYSSASAATKVLNADNGWQYNFSGLPREKDIANAAGDFSKTVKYYYKAVETKIGDADVSGKLYYETADGFYKITNSGESNAGNSAQYLSITNEYRSKIDLTVNKNWNGDKGSGNNIGSVSFRIEYDLNGDGNWKPLKTKTADGTDWLFDGTGNDKIFVINDTSSWNTTIENLPVYIYQGGTVKTVRYRAIETKVDNKELENKKVFVDNGYYEASDSAVVDGTYNQNSNQNTATLTNTFHKTQSIPIKVTKYWNKTGDDNADKLTAVEVELQQCVEGTNDWVTVDTQTLTGDSWSYTWIDKAPTQKIENGTITKYKYRVVETGYTYDGKDYAIKTDKFSTDANKGYYEVKNSSEIRGDNENNTQYANITNTFMPLKTYKITAQKKWDDEKNAKGQRPKKIWLKLERYDGDKWEDYGDEIELNAENFADDSEYWQCEISDLPQSYVKSNENGTVEVVNYKYKLGEVKYQYDDGQPTTISGGSFRTPSIDGVYSYIVGDSDESIVSYDNQQFTVTNTFDEETGIEKKVIFDGNATTNLKIDADELESLKKTIDGEEYYVFNWQIQILGLRENSNNGSGSYDINQDITPIVDTLPDGFSLCTIENPPDTLTVPIENEDLDKTAQNILNTIGEGYFDSPYIGYIGYNFANGFQPAQSWEYVFESQNSQYYFINGQKFALSEPDVWAKVVYVYSTKIKVSDLDAKMGNKKTFTFSNKAEMYGGGVDKKPDEETGKPIGKSESATVKITNSTPTNLITKTYSETPINGTVKYTLDINPNGLNLSTGSSIDITDIFKVTKYVDHIDNREYTDESGHLVDVLLSNIKIYSVAANGAETLLPDNKYTLQFDSSTATAEGAALQKLEVPDETHLKVEYLYKIVANENTPSVIMNRNSSIRKNGKLQKMAPGMTPPDGDKITFSNKANLSSDSATGESHENNKEYVFASSSGSIWTEKMPSIAKVNVADITKKLDASFLLAKYENGAWYYATNVNENTRAVTWSSSPVSGNGVASGTLAELKVSSSSTFSLDLSTGVLYKLVEIAVPKDYEGSNLGLDADGFKALIKGYLNDGTTKYKDKDYKAFLEKFKPISYFSYNSTVTNLPAGLKRSDVQNIKQNGELDIKNNELINIGVKKNWVQAVTGSATIDVELWWSYTKDDTKIPNDAKLAHSTELGIMDSNFSAVKTIKIGTTANADVWTDLPNGNDGRIIYYYVKETAYTVKDTKYSLKSDGTYKSENGDVGAYYPTYINNAVSSDKTVTINNSGKLKLKKGWKDSTGKDITPNLSSINVSIIGIREDDGEEVTLFENIKLEKAKKWECELDTSDIDLSIYKSFKAEESGDALADYVVSCVFKINNNTGEITVTNKDTNLTEEAVSVKKKWSDGEENHSSDSVKVKLYRSTTKYTMEEILNFDNNEFSMRLTAVTKDKNDDSFGDVVLNADNEWSYTWNALPVKSGSAKVYYYVIEDTTAGSNNQSKYTPLYDIDTSAAGLTKVTITNFRKAVMVEKQWIDAEGNYIEDTESLPEIELEILPSYGSNSNSIKKIVQDRDYIEFVDICSVLGDDFTYIQPDGCHPNALGYEKIADAYYNAINSLYDSVPTETLDIVALGDSITEGYRVGLDGTVDSYPTHLTRKLNSKGYKLKDSSVVNAGVSTKQIPDFVYNNNYGKITEDTNIILLLGGTNDIHQSGSTVHGNPEEVCKRLETLINTLHTTAPKAKIILGTIPYFVFEKSDGTITTGGGWWYNANSGYTPKELAAINNKAIKELNYGVVTDSDIIKVKLNNSNDWKAIVDLPEDADPDTTYIIREESVPDGWTVEYKDNGQKAGSSIVMKAVNKHNPPKTTITVKKEWVGDAGEESKRNGISLTLQRTTDNGENWEDCSAVMPEPVKSGNTWTYTYSNLPAKDTANNEYKYRVVESSVPDGYFATYSNESGVTFGTLTVTNTFKVSLKVQKIWNDDKEHSDDTVRIKISRSTNSTSNSLTEDDLMLDIQTEVSMIQGYDETITANKNIEIVSIGDASILEAAVNGKSLTISGKSKGTTNIVVKSGDEEKTITVTVNDVLSVNPTSVKLVVGGTATLDTNRNGVDVKYDSDVFEAEVNNDTIKVTALSAGTGTFMVKYGDDEVTVNVEVVERLRIDASPNPITEGGMVTLTPAEGVIYTVDGTEISGNTFYAKSPGTVEVQGKFIDDTFENESDKLNITVNAFAIQGNGEVTIGGYTQLTSNAPNDVNVTWSLSEEDKNKGFSVDNNGKVSADNAESGAKATVTASFESNGKTYTDTFEVTAKAGFTLNGQSNLVFTMIKGQTMTFTADRTIDGVTTSYGATATLSDDKKIITFTASNESWATEDKIYITYTLDGVITNVECTINLINPLSCSISTNSMEVGDTATLTPDSAHEVEYSGYDENVISINGNTVTAHRAGSTTITVTSLKTDETMQIPVTVLEYEWVSLTLNASNEYDVSQYVGMVKSIEVTITNSSSINVKLFDNNNNPVPDEWNNTKNITYYGTSGEVNVSEYSALAKFEVIAGGENNSVTSVKVKVPKTTSTTSLISEISAASSKEAASPAPKAMQKSGIGLRRSVAVANINEIDAVSKNSNIFTTVRTTGVESEDYDSYTFEDNDYIYITLSADDDFKYVLENLDVFDENGNPYYYTMEEVHVNDKIAKDGYSISYSFTDKDDNTVYSVNASKLDNDSVMTVRNTEKESSSVILPEAGGMGTAKIYFTGGFILLLAAAGYVMFKRRRVNME